MGDDGEDDDESGTYEVYGQVVADTIVNEFSGATTDVECGAAEEDEGDEGAAEDE